MLPLYLPYRSEALVRSLTRKCSRRGLSNLIISKTSSNAVYIASSSHFSSSQYRLWLAISSVLEEKSRIWKEKLHNGLSVAKSGNSGKKIRYSHDAKSEMYEVWESTIYRTRRIFFRLLPIISTLRKKLCFFSDQHTDFFNMLVQVKFQKPFSLYSIRRKEFLLSCELWVILLNVKDF